MPSYAMTYTPLGSTMEVSTVLQAASPLEAFRKLPAFEQAQITNNQHYRRKGKISGAAYNHQKYLERIQK